MLPRLSLIIGLTALATSSCAHRPMTPPLKHTVCVSDPESFGLSCYNSRTDTSFIRPYHETETWVCRPPESEHLLMNYCKAHGSE